MEYSDMMKSHMDGCSRRVADALELMDGFLCGCSKDMPEEVEDLLVRVSGVLDGRHFTKDTAEWAVDRMVPTLLIQDGRRFEGTVLGYMKDGGLTPHRCMELAKEAYRKAVSMGATFGYQPSSIPDSVNENDAFVAFAMVVADYWMDMCDTDKAAELAYQWLSDPDAEPTKTWDYLMD